MRTRVHVYVYREFLSIKVSKKTLSFYNHLIMNVELSGFFLQKKH